MAILAPIAAMLVQMAISRTREFQADASGARLAGRPWGLAKALEKLEMASTMAPMHATPATAHLFIVNPLRGGGLIEPLLDTPVDPGAGGSPPRHAGLESSAVPDQSTGAAAAPTPIPTALTPASP